MVDLARKNLLHDKLRFGITICGVAFAVALVLIQIGLFSGLLDNATTTIEHLRADLWVTSHNTPSIDFAHSFPATRVNRVRAIPGVERADNLIVTYGEIALPSGVQENTQIYGLHDFAYWNVPWNVTAGALEDLRRGRYFFLDESAARRFGAFKVGDYRELRGQRLRIIGTTKEAMSFTTAPVSFMDFRMAQSLGSESLAGETHYILVKLAAGADAALVRAEIARRLPFNDVYTRDEWARRSRNFWIESTGLGFNMFATVFLGCLVGVVIVAQTLYAATMEHLQEFGTLKAIGGTNGDVYRLLAKQACFAAVFGFALGTVPSYFVRPLIESRGLKLLVPASLTGTVFVGTVVLCLAAAMISFRKVARIDPAMVFRG